jgi:hypothetical protein
MVHMPGPTELRKMLDTSAPCVVCRMPARYVDPDGRTLCTDHGGLPPISQTDASVCPDAES